MAMCLHSRNSSIPTMPTSAGQPASEPVLGGKGVALGVFRKIVTGRVGRTDQNDLSQ